MLLARRDLIPPGTRDRVALVSLARAGGRELWRRLALEVDGDDRVSRGRDRASVLA